ncbi:MULTISPECIES: hypothetical protein [unclassified Bacillus (in: firmicutes)]|uniref:hypothetical protein n=1 Tax=unclassified Bacillus (in: firmicutes) TaxID=185979 RepID=UPI0025B4AC2B|nr:MULTISPECIES: hypothetical protein [unclassified Bacillus (in: firmicutes)]MDN0189855.1 hypothetical protein [Bacillus sp. B.PNR1]MDN3034099.1 hypothetical protein [Bacillus sp. B.PNR2]
MLGTAILSKIDQIFSNYLDRQVTSFLPIAESWNMQELAFELPTSMTGISAREITDLCGNFSRRVNRIPTRSDTWGSTDIYLWDIYKEILESRVSLADLPNTNKEKTRLTNSKRIIGSPSQPSKKYQVYKKYQDKYRHIEDKLNQAKLTHMSTTDSVLKEIAMENCNNLTRQLSEIEQEWISFGYKGEIEAALLILTAEYTSSSLYRWTTWKNDFSTINQQNDTLGSFWPTGYRPKNLYNNEEGWLKFTLSGSEVQSLAESASDKIKNMQSTLNNNIVVDGEIDKVSMEIARIDIERSWLHPEIFKSRSWKFSNPDQPLISDGAIPWPNGTLPGYIIGLILVRNIYISWKSPPSTSSNNSFGIIGNFAVKTDDLKEIGEPILIRAIEGDHLIKLIQERFTDPTFPELRPDNILELINSDHVRDFINNYNNLRPVILPESTTTGTNPLSTEETHSNSDVRLMAYLVQQTPKIPNPAPSLIWN